MTSAGTEVIKLPMEASPQERWRRLALLVGLTSMVAAPGFFLLVHDVESRRSAGAAFWRVEGTPCAPLDAATFRDVQRGPSVTKYDGVTLERHGGGLVCTHRTRIIAGANVRYPVCKLNAPDYLAVSAGGQQRFYDLTMGRSAAVEVVNGQVRCAVSSPFEM